LCALTQANLKTTPATWLDILLDPKVHVGTSTSKGDYAREMFYKARASSAGAYATLDAKALKITGGADSPMALAGRHGLWCERKKRRAFGRCGVCHSLIGSTRTAPQSRTPWTATACSLAETKIGLDQQLAHRRRQTQLGPLVSTEPGAIELHDSGSRHRHLNRMQIQIFVS
jgi:hypothetical protein